MSDIITRHQLAALGLPDARPGDVERIAWPDEPVAHALGLTPPEVTSFALAVSLLGSGDLAFARVRSGLAEREGIALHALETNRRIVCAVSRDPAVPLAVLDGPDRRAPRHQPPQDPGTVYVDLSHGPCVLRAARQAIAVAADPAGLVVQEVVEAPERVAGPVAERTSLGPEGLAGPSLLHLSVPPGGPPVRRWAEGAGDDWLAKEVARLTTRGDRWHQVVAAGVVARLAEPPPGPRFPGVALRAAEPPALGRSRLAWTASRIPADPAVEPRRWVRDLDGRDLQAIEERATEQAGQLGDALRRFESRLEPDVASWHAEWLAVCHRRDDLESVLVLLREAARGAALARALVAVDEMGRRLRFHVPDEPFAGDERARRVRLGDPGAWWGMPDPGDLL